MSYRGPRATGIIPAASVPPPHHHTMSPTTIVGVLLACGLSTSLGAQGRGRGQTAEELISQRDRKLAETWLQQGNWTTSFADAKARAKREGKLIFGYFTRSYAP